MKQIYSKLIILLLAISASTICHAGMVLADNGKTSYQVCSRIENPGSGEKAAIRDLCNYLKIISKADFATAKGKKYQITVGEAAPSDKNPLKKNERRIVSENGNIYIWGEGRHGNTNAVYDFLKDVMGCRWFTVTGDRKIPSRKRIELDELNLSVVPSVPVVTINQFSPASPPSLIKFARINGLLPRTDGLIGPNGHAIRQLIPCGQIPFGKKEGALDGPWKTVKNKAYFKTNPEFFSMNEKGRRNRDQHYCFSNPELRKEFVKNISGILTDAKYDGSAADFAIDHDDRRGRFCHCPECLALEKKYDHMSGAYFDFVLYVADEIGKKYPNIMLHIIAYQQTLRPPAPDKLKSFPPNVMVRYAPLTVDFAKPYTHPSNKSEAERFKGWGKVTHHMRWSAYPTTYPRPTVNFPLTANVHRCVANIDFAYANGIVNAYLEFGAGPADAFAFNDLRLYIHSEKLRRINADEQELIKEFTDACYGKAAPALRKYLAELEAEELNTKKFMRWNPQIHYVDYATAGNLLKWTADFDAMEKTVAGKPRHLLNLRRVRFALDQTIIIRWPYLTAAEQQEFGDLEKIIDRCNKIILDHNADVASSFRQPIKRKNYIRQRVAWHNSGFDQITSVARGGKPLPGFLQKKGKLFRFIPNNNKKPLNKDPEAAFGLANFAKYPKHNRPIFILHYFENAKRSAMLRWDVPKIVNRKRIEKTAKDNKYHWYHLGAVPMREDGVLMFSNVSPQSNFPLGHLYNPEDPDLLYDLYVSCAADKKKGLLRIDQLVVVPLNKRMTAEQKKHGGKLSNEDIFL